jgi:thymidine kinase
MNVQFPILGTTGWIEVICGSMFSGKTEELIRRMKRAQIAKVKSQIFKPQIDSRYSPDHVTSHSSLKLDAMRVSNPEEILMNLHDNTRIVGIDEAQFFAPSIVDICHRLANRGLRVIVAGLDMDYRGVPFGPMPLLMATAEYVTKMCAICTVCGNPASRSQRKRMESGTTDSSGQVLVGAEEHYEARCRRCYEPPC